MANEDYKNGKLVEIVREFNNTGNQYEVNGIKQSIAVPFWRRENDKFQVIPKGSYSFINEAGNDYLKILDSTILQQATQFQIVYDYLQLSSKYIEDFPDVVVLTEKYNQLVDDTTNLFSYLKSVGMTSDTLQLTKVLAQLEPLTTWYMNENGEIKALPISDLYEKFGNLIKAMEKVLDEYIEQKKEEIRGPAGAIDNVTASVNSNAGTPKVTVSLGGTPERRKIDLKFENLKGDKPIKGTDYYTQQEKEQFTTEMVGIVKTEGSKVVEQVKSIVAGNPTTTNALTLSGKTRVEFEQDTQALVGKYDGKFPLYSATEDNVYFLESTGEYYVCTRKFKGELQLISPNENFRKINIIDNTKNIEELKLIDNEFIKKSSYNKFNGKYLKGYIDGNNSVVDEIKYAHSDSIYLENTTYLFNAATNRFGNNALIFCECNSLGVLTGKRILGELIDQTKRIGKITIPKKGYYKVNIGYLLDVDKFMIIKGSELQEFPETYHKYELEIEEDINFGESMKEYIGKHTSKIYNFYNNEDADIEQGYFITSYNEKKSDHRFQISGYIPVEVGKSYTFPIYYSKIGSNALSVPLYDKDKTYVSRIAGARSDELLTVTIPSGDIAYTRINIPVKFTREVITSICQNPETFMFVEGKEYPERYYQYGELREYIDDRYINQMISDNFNPLFGKSIYFTGDSICEGEELSGWAGRIGRRNKMLWINKGVGGATISTGTGVGKYIVDTDFEKGADYIILEGGTNDADRIKDNLSLFGSYTQNDYNSEFDKTTFCGAVESLFKRVISDYPNAKVGFIIAHKMGSSEHYDKDNNNRRKFFETIMILCKKWGIPYINLWDTCPLNPKIPSMYTKGNPNSLYLDGQHLTAKGYDRITPMIESWIKTL